MSTTTSPPLLEALRVRWPGLDAIGGDPHEWVRVCDVPDDLGRQMLDHLNGQTRADGRCPTLADVFEAKRLEAWQQERRSGLARIAAIRAEHAFLAPKDPANTGATR